MSYPDHYLKGIDLFNRGHFWHAHEEWEDAWKDESDPEVRLFYKGIIQTAAALVHWQRGNSRGLHLNWGKARRKLSELPDELLGLHIRELVDYMDRFEAGQGAELDPPKLDIRT